MEIINSIKKIYERIFYDLGKYNIDVEKAVKIFGYLLLYHTPEQLTEYASESEEQFYAGINYLANPMLLPSNHYPRPPGYISPPSPPISRLIASTSSFRGPAAWHDPHLTSNAQLGGGSDSRGSMIRSPAAAPPGIMPPWGMIDSSALSPISQPIASTSSFRGPPAWHPHLTSNAQLGGGLDSRGGGSMIRSPAAAPPGIMPPSGMRSPAAPAPSPIFRLVTSTSSFRGGPASSNIHHYSDAQLGGDLDSMRSPAAAPPGIIPPSGMRSPAEACRFFNSGFCRKGKSCTFPHVFIPDHGISQDDDISSGGPRGQLSVVLAEDALKYKEKSDLYLTFPSESTFTEDDVINYFEKFGPVLEVRIPYQEKDVWVCELPVPTD